jgi:excisionase family DNA binding protein
MDDRKTTKAGRCALPCRPVFSEDERGRVKMPLGIYEVKDIMRIMHISRNTAYKLLRQEDIPHMRVGGHYKIPAERFHQWLDLQFARLNDVPNCAIMDM